MKLRIATPFTICVDESDIAALRAEDESGSFGILPGHADFLTTLSVSVVGWRRSDNASRYCAVRRGILTVSEGARIEIATREAVVGDDIDSLEAVVLDQLSRSADEERVARAESTRLHIKAIREMVRLLYQSGREI